jgi:DNA helicase MCM8
LNENNQTIDWQKITVQEKLTDDQVDAGRIPRTIDCELTMHLVDKLVPGDVVSVSGIVKMLPSEETQKVGMTQMFNLYIDANCIAKVHGGDLSEVEQLGNSKDAEEFDENELHVITDIKSSYNLFSLLVNSFCPLIFGNELVKAGLLLALFGGTRRDGRSNHMRPDIHVLIVGDPGLGKSQMLLSALKLAPRGV